MRFLPEAERFVADTHAVIWHIESSPRLSPEARRYFEMSDRGDAVIFFSVITSVELLYLYEKGKISRRIWDSFHHSVLSKPNESYQIVDFSYQIAQGLSRVPADIIPEMPDRIIAATAKHLNIPLITRDHRLHQWSGIATIW